MIQKELSVGEAERKAKELMEEEDEQGLYDLAVNLLNQDKVLGSANDFHNFSLNYSRMDADELACSILEKGLELYPHSVDLLADYLQTGINCNKRSECNNYSKVLLGIPKVRWTWRGFSFLIDYMLFIADDLSEQNLDNWKQKMLNIASEYKQLFPFEEDPYICVADIHSYFNDYPIVIRTLEKAVREIPVCPKCSLRLADLLFDAGEYSKSLEVLNKCLYQSIQTQDSVNHSYLYYLSGLCKTVELLKNGKLDDEKLVIDIYHDFSIAQKTGLNHASYNKVMRRQIDILETKTGFVYTE